MKERYQAEGQRVMRDGRHFCFAITDGAARTAAEALNRCEAMDNPPVGNAIDQQPGLPVDTGDIVTVDLTDPLRNLISNPDIRIEPKDDRQYVPIGASFAPPVSMTVPNSIEKSYVHHDDCQCPACVPPMGIDADQIDEATGCPHAFRSESDEYVCANISCGVRWGKDEQRPNCRYSKS